MSTLLWTIAVLDLIGGIVIAVEMENFIGVVVGIVTFALVGGFASVVGLLSEIRDKLPSLKNLESSQKELDEKLNTISGKIAEMNWSLDQIKRSIDKIEKSPVSVSNVTPDTNTVSKAAVIEVPKERTEEKQQVQETASDETYEKEPTQEKVEVPEADYELIKNDLQYAAGLSSVNRARSIVKNLYRNTHYAPLEAVLAKPDDQLKGAIKALLEQI